MGCEWKVGHLTCSVTPCDDGCTDFWCVADIMQVNIIGQGYERRIERTAHQKANDCASSYLAGQTKD